MNITNPTTKLKNNYVTEAEELKYPESDLN